MSVNDVTHANIQSVIAKLGSKGAQATTGAAAQATGAGQAASFSAVALRVADFQTQVLGSLMGSAFATGETGTSSSVDALLASLNSSTNPLAGASGGSPLSALSPTGRNLALSAPEPAYEMMSLINTQEVVYKAQFSQLSEMHNAVADLQQNAQSLGGISTSTDNASIKTQLQSFTSQYNAWIKRFDADMQEGGSLAGVQAAEVSRYELKQSVENRFNGAMHGVKGLRDLGLSIDPNSKLATLDTTRLDSVLAGNKAGAVDSLQEFSANFVKSAELLTSDNNFIHHRLDNLSRAIAFIEDNKPALQAEFGLGDPAQPVTPVAQAVAAYNEVKGI